VPDFDRQDRPRCDTVATVTDSAARSSSRQKSSYRIPITPPPSTTAGNYVISLSKLVSGWRCWWTSAGVNLGSMLRIWRRGVDLLWQWHRGVITEDKGLDKTANPGQLTPGYELRAKVTVLGEGHARPLTEANS